MKISKLTIFWTLNLVLISILLVFCVFRVSVLTQERYLLKNYEKKFNKLSRSNEALEISFSKLDSLSNIKNYLVNENFVKAAQVKYIQILEGSVASK